MYQQQENQKFMSHFHKKFVICHGRRNLALNSDKKWPELFHMRANGLAVCNRTIQIECRAEMLNSAFFYILNYPNLNTDKEGVVATLGQVFVWEGTNADPYYHPIAETVCFFFTVVKKIIFAFYCKIIYI